MPTSTSCLLEVAHVLIFLLILLPSSKWIGVPGEIRGYEKVHKLYGKLPWATLFQPTIQLAREGFPIPDILGRYISHIDTNETQSLRKLFSDVNGNLLKTGDIIKYEKLADTLEMIADHGADDFYTGRIAEDLIRDVQEAGGTLSLEDLTLYNVTVTDAWVVPLGDYQMYIPPPIAGHPQPHPQHHERFLLETDVTLRAINN